MEVFAEISTSCASEGTVIQFRAVSAGLARAAAEALLQALCTAGGSPRARSSWGVDQQHPGPASF